MDIAYDNSFFFFVFCSFLTRRIMYLYIVLYKMLNFYSKEKKTSVYILFVSRTYTSTNVNISYVNKQV